MRFTCIPSAIDLRFSYSVTGVLSGYQFSRVFLSSKLARVEADLHANPNIPAQNLRDDAKSWMQASSLLPLTHHNSLYHATTKPWRDGYYRQMLSEISEHVSCSTTAELFSPNLTWYCRRNSVCPQPQTKALQWSLNGAYSPSVPVSLSHRGNQFHAPTARTLSRRSGTYALTHVIGSLHLSENTKLVDRMGIEMCIPHSRALVGVFKLLQREL